MSARDLACWEEQWERHEEVVVDDLRRALHTGSGHWGEESERLGELLASVTALTAFPARRWWDGNDIGC